MSKSRRFLELGLVVVALSAAVGAYLTVQKVEKKAATAAPEPRGGIVTTALERTKASEAIREEVLGLETRIGVRCGLDFSAVTCVGTLRTIASDAALVDSITVLRQAGVRVTIFGQHFLDRETIGRVSDEGAVWLYVGHSAQEYLAFLAS